MTDQRQAAIDAAEAGLYAFLEPWLGHAVHGTTLVSQIHAAAVIAVREAGPSLAAAERARLLHAIRGYRIGGRVYAPADVEIITTGGDPEMPDLPKITEVQRYAYRPGDRLLVRVEREPSDYQAVKVRERVREILQLGDDVPILVNGPRSGVEVLAPEDADGAALIAAERRRQVDAEGWTAEHDDAHAGYQLARAGAYYALWAAGVTDLPGWPWDIRMFKPGDPVRTLTKAGALIAAEIDRLQRQQPTTPEETRDERDQLADDLLTARRRQAALAQELTTASATIINLREIRDDLARQVKDRTSERDIHAERLHQAQYALIEDGYFTLAQVGPDIAPRITERLAELARARDDYAHRLKGTDRAYADAAAERDRLRERVTVLEADLDRRDARRAAELGPGVVRPSASSADTDTTGR